MKLRAVKHNGYVLDGNHNPIAYTPYVLDENNVVQRYDFCVVEEFQELDLYNYGVYSVPFSVFEMDLTSIKGTQTDYGTYFDLYAPPNNLVNGSHIYYRTTDAVNFNGYSKIVVKATVVTKNPVQSASGGFVTILSPTGTFLTQLLWLPPNCSEYEITLPIPTGLTSGHVTLSANCYAITGDNNTSTMSVYQVILIS